MHTECKTPTLYYVKICAKAKYMKRLTIDKFSTLFQLVIIALLFIYAAFPGKSIGLKKPSDNNPFVDKTIETQKEVKTKSKNWLSNDKLPKRPENSNGLAWIMPDMKNIMNPHTEISANQPGNTLKISTK
jgi:hypothetical protein